MGTRDTANTVRNGKCIERRGELFEEVLCANTDTALVGAAGTTCRVPGEDGMPEKRESAIEAMRVYGPLARNQHCSIRFQGRWPLAI